MNIESRETGVNTVEKKLNNLEGNDNSYVSSVEKIGELFPRLNKETTRECLEICNNTICSDKNIIAKGDFLKTLENLERA